MQRTELPNFPTNLPGSTEVRDYALDNGKFGRVILEIKDGPNDHFEMHAQAYEMTATGDFVPAIKGYPSRSRSTVHTAQKSALSSKELSIDDGWVKHSENFDPVNPGETVLGHGDPMNSSVDHFGDTYYDQDAMRLWIFKEGYADSVARAKIEELVAIIENGPVLSGVAFR